MVFIKTSEKRSEIELTETSQDRVHSKEDEVLSRGVPQQQHNLESREQKQE